MSGVGNGIAVIKSFVICCVATDHIRNPREKDLRQLRSTCLRENSPLD